MLALRRQQRTRLQELVSSQVGPGLTEWGIFTEDPLRANTTSKIYYVYIFANPYHTDYPDEDTKLAWVLRSRAETFLVVPGVNNLPANAGDTGPIPDPRKFHMLQGY